MTLAQLQTLIATAPKPVILLEGRRSISSADFRMARLTALGLAKLFPQALFRSGNADGSDQAFADGVAEIDPARLQIIAPYEGHRRKFRKEGAHYDSPESLTSLQEEAIAKSTVQASPAISRLIERRATGGPLAAKARYLMRDTMKVVDCTKDIPPPTAALFYIDLTKPEAGGTGHTIRVCQQHGVPCIFQDQWGSWFNKD